MRTIPRAWFLPRRTFPDAICGPVGASARARRTPCPPFCGYVPPQPPTAVNATCLQDPSQSKCAGYQLTTVEADIADLCDMMPNMPGCALNQLCLSSSSPAAITGSPFCGRFAVLRTLCVDMPGMAGCSNYVALCKVGSVVVQCSTQIPTFPTTMYLTTTVPQLCTNTSYSSICSSCTQTATCNLISTYAQICRLSSDSKCAGYTTACSNQQLASFPWCQTSYTAPSSVPSVKAPSSIVPTAARAPSAAGREANVAFGLLAVVVAFVVFAL